jgi:hypothetical protein
MGILPTLGSPRSRGHGRIKAGLEPISGSNSPTPHTQDRRHGDFENSLWIAFPLVIGGISLSQLRIDRLRWRFRALLFRPLLVAVAQLAKIASNLKRLALRFPTGEGVFFHPERRTRNVGRRQATGAELRCWNRQTSNFKRAVSASCFPPPA